MSRRALPRWLAVLVFLALTASATWSAWRILTDRADFAAVTAAGRDRVAR